MAHINTPPEDQAKIPDWVIWPFALVAAAAWPALGVYLCFAAVRWVVG